MSEPSLCSGDKMMKDIADIFTRNGIFDYVVAFADIDECISKLRINGSPHWRVGVGWDISTQAKKEIQEGRVPIDLGDDEGEEENA